MMKRINRTWITVLVVIILVISLIPALLVRVNYEQAHKNVVVAVSYNDLSSVSSTENLDRILQNYYDAGVTVINVPEEDAFSLAARGEITLLTFGELRSQSDENKAALAACIAQQAPETDYSSYVMIPADSNVADYLRNVLPQRYSADEYTEVICDNSVSAFVMYDGSPKDTNVLLGFDETSIARLKENGYQIALALRIQDCSTTGYLDVLEELVKKYDVRYLQLIKSLTRNEDEELELQHAEKLSRILQEHDLTMVINESFDQLSNNTPFVYQEAFKDNHTNVIRAYENPTTKYTTEADKAYALYSMFFNSTIDRHIRFINIAQVEETERSTEARSEITISAARQYIDKITSLGYTVNGENVAADYAVDRTVIYVISAAVMVLLCYLMFVMLTGNEDKKWNLAAYILAALAAAASFVMPAGLTSLYPTAWAVIMPCFCITTVFVFIKHTKAKLSAPVLSVLTPVFAVALMFAGGIVMCSMLSGIDYYVNNLVFRGVKISLILPIFYGVVAYFFLFMDTKKYLSVDGVKNLLTSQIQVYWVLLAGVVAVVGYVYILRSGNVNTISSVERIMRDTLAEFFAARPRTKEFLVGWPCLVLFAYYMKKTNLPLIQMALAAGGSIVIASISNSYCHVFTDALTIYSRTLNGLIVGAVVSVAAYLVNLLLVKIVKIAYARIAKP